MPNLWKVCIECKKEFYHNEADQNFYKSQGFVEPKRCYHCRKARKEQKMLELQQQQNSTDKN